MKETYERSSVATDQALDSLLCIKEDCDSVHLENDCRRWILYQYLPHLTDEEPQAQQGEGTWWSTASTWWVVELDLAWAT